MSDDDLTVQHAASVTDDGQHAPLCRNGFGQLQASQPRIVTCGDCLLAMGFRLMGTSQLVRVRFLSGCAPVADCKAALARFGNEARAIEWLRRENGDRA